MWFSLRVLSSLDGYWAHLLGNLKIPRGLFFPFYCCKYLLMGTIHWICHFKILAVVQLLSHLQFFVTPWTAACQASLSITNSQSLLKLMHVHCTSDAIQPSHPLSFHSPPSLNLSHHQGLFKWVSSLHQVAKVLEFQLQNQSFQWIISTDFL